MEIRDQIIKEAKSWIGTDYVDHAGIKGAGVDCAFYPCRVYQSAGLIPKEFKPPKYSSQQWMNKPKLNHRHVVDTTYLDTLLQFAVEITEAEVKPGDLVLYKVIHSWTHGAIVVDWPNYVLHPLVGRGVIGSHGTKEGFLLNRPRRFFTFIKD